jgi:hypothetical protein
MPEDKDHLLYYTQGQVYTWTDVGHPELEGEPMLATINGPVKVPPRPPMPGARYPRRLRVRRRPDHQRWKESTMSNVTDPKWPSAAQPKVKNLAPTGMPKAKARKLTLARRDPRRKRG